MSKADSTLDARLRALDPSPAARRPVVTGTDWGAAIVDRITVAPSDSRSKGAQTRPRRSRRAIRAAVSGAGVLTLVAVMAVLLVSTNGKDASAPAGSQLEVIASPLAGSTVTPSLLSQAASTLRARAATLGLQDVTVIPQGADTIIIGVPDGTLDPLAALTAPGDLRIEAAGPQLPEAPAITAEDIAGARTANDDGMVSVVVTFTDAGAAAFKRLTRAVAQAGALRGEPQALSITLDGLELSAPTIDYETYPDGIDGSFGTSILLPGGMDPRTVAAQIDSGPLPVRLTRTPGDLVPATPGMPAPPAKVERVDPGSG